MNLYFPFQWAPTLGGECYGVWQFDYGWHRFEFQWAPTLGGECYLMEQLKRAFEAAKFQWAPTLGGECYGFTAWRWIRDGTGFNGHPPLGVNATQLSELDLRALYLAATRFQWAPTLGGECYKKTRATFSTT